jgi:hypothetical protein
MPMAETIIQLMAVQKEMSDSKKAVLGSNKAILEFIAWFTLPSQPGQRQSA